jgi:hypothetical protein
MENPWRFPPRSLSRNVSTPTFACAACSLLKDVTSLASKRRRHHGLCNRAAVAATGRLWGAFVTTGINPAAAVRMAAAPAATTGIHEEREQRDNREHTAEKHGRSPLFRGKATAALRCRLPCQRSGYAGKLRHHLAEFLGLNESMRAQRA